MKNVDIIGRAKKVPLTNFANFSRTVEGYDIQNLAQWLLIQSLVNLESFILQNWQNYAAFNHVNFAVETLSKIVSTIQESANAISANTFWVEVNASKVPSPFIYSCQTVCKTRDSFINWTCGKLSHATFNSETVLVSDEGF